MSRCISYNSVQSLNCVSFWPHRLQHTRPLCPSPTPRACSNSCPSSWWCHPTISSSFIPFSFYLQSFPASGSFPMSQFFASSGGQRIGTSGSVLSMNVQGCFPLGLTGWISLQCNSPSYVRWSAWATNGVRNLWILHNETKTVCMGKGFGSPDSSCCLSWH